MARRTASTERARTWSVALVALMVLPAWGALGASSPAWPEGQPELAARPAADLPLPSFCQGPLRKVAGVGPSCPREDGGWAVLLRDGSWMTTHGFDSDLPYEPRPGIAAVVPPLCIADAAAQHHNYAVYVWPTDGTDRYAEAVETIRSGIGGANDLLRFEAQEFFSSDADFRFLCDADGQVHVEKVALTTSSQQSSLQSVIDDLKAQGYNSTRAHYWVSYDHASLGGFSGGISQGAWDGNYGPKYHVVTSCCYHDAGYQIHEATHNLAAVIPGIDGSFPPAPHSTGSDRQGGWHCNDGKDIMCYADGGPNSSYSEVACKDFFHYDCNHDTYFNPKPNPDSWLAVFHDFFGTPTNFNIGRPENLFVNYQNDCASGTEAGDSFATATRILGGDWTAPITCTGTLASGDDEDWFRFPFDTTGSGSQSVSLSLTPQANAAYDLCVYRPSGGDPVVCGTSLQPYVDEDGDWRARVHKNGSPVHGNYTLTLTTTSAGYNGDCTGGEDAGPMGADHFVYALSITPPILNCPGSLELLNYPWEEDWYKFNVTNGGVINVSMTPNPAKDYKLCLYTPAQDNAACSDNAGNGTPERILHTATAGGEWYAQVYIDGNPWWSPSPYDYTLSVFTGPADDCGGTGDAGTTAATARVVDAPLTDCPASLFLSPSDDPEDWYKVNLWTSQKLTFTATPNAAADIDVCILKPNTATQKCYTRGNGTADDATFTATETGDWLAQVYAYQGWHYADTQGAGRYTVSASVTQNDCDLGGDMPGDFASATALPWGGVNDCPGLLDAADAEDWYKFYSRSSEKIWLNLTMFGDVDFDLCLYKETDSANAAACSRTATNGAKETILLNATETGDWRVRVFRPAGSATGNYTLTQRVSANDCSTDADAPNTHADAITITLPKDCAGTTSTSDNDYYKFKVVKNDVMKVSIAYASWANFDLCLYKPNDANNAVQCSATGSYGGTESITYTATASGDWRARVYSVYNDGNYTMSVCKNC